MRRGGRKSKTQASESESQPKRLMTMDDFLEILDDDLDSEGLKVNSESVDTSQENAAMITENTAGPASAERDAVEGQASGTKGRLLKFKNMISQAAQANKSIQELSASVSGIKDGVDTQVDGLKALVNEALGEIRRKNHLLAEIEEKVELLCEKQNTSSSSLDDSGTDFEDAGQLERDRSHEEPFVFTTIMGKKYDLKFDRNERLQVAAASKIRPLVRVVLKHFYSIPELRLLTLNGWGKSKLDGKREARPMVAAHVIALAMECTLKAIPLPGSAENNAQAEMLKAVRMDKVRAAITSLAQYYSKKYGTDGRRIAKQKEEEEEEEGGRSCSTGSPSE